MNATFTYAVYEMTLESTPQCVHSEPFDRYVGSTHVGPGHPATARIKEHKAGYNSKVVSSGYRIVSCKVVRQDLSTREAAEETEGRHASRLRSRGKKVWCDK